MQRSWKAYLTTLPQTTHIPGGVDFIAAGAFYGCHAWCSVTWIGNHAFSGCAALHNFHARPEGIIYGNLVFSACSMLLREIRQRSPEGVAAFFLRPFHRD